MHLEEKLIEFKVMDEIIVIINMFLRSNQRALPSQSLLNLQSFGLRVRVPR